MITGILIWRIFQIQQQPSLSKIITCGAAQFMSWIQVYKATYLVYPSGKPNHLQRSILFTNHIMQVQWLWYSTQKRVVYNLNSMWCLTKSSSQFHSWGKRQYPKIRQIFWNEAYKSVHQKIFISKIHGSLQILKRIPEKLQDKNQVFF